MSTEYTTILISYTSLVFQDVIIAIRDETVHGAIPTTLLTVQAWTNMTNNLNTLLDLSQRTYSQYLTLAFPFNSKVYYEQSKVYFLPQKTGSLSR